MDAKNKIFFKDSKLQNYIKIIKNGMTPVVCDIISNEYTKSNDWVNWNSQSDIIFLNEQNVNTKKRKYIQDLIFSTFMRLEFIVELKKTYNVFNPRNNGYNLIKQKIFKDNALDKLNYNNKDGDIVTIIQLNDDYEGGEISFFNGNYKIKLKKGMIITFPLNILYDYEILPIFRGERYFLISFLSTFNKY